ncbi:MAG: ribonuclease HI [Patescibacteria group bacterium]|nr:ribonuclease HI [Patescibacteria group bacterium]
MMDNVSVYVDGGCKGNPGPGGWAYLIFSGDERRKDSGGVIETTNNRMELMAAIKALGAVASEVNWAGRSVYVYSDSQYVCKGMSEWMMTWERNNWRMKDGNPVKNKDLWFELQKISYALNTVRWKWIQGHGKNRPNGICDQMVQKEIKNLFSLAR